jgi:hypothetical protein
LKAARLAVDKLNRLQTTKKICTKEKKIRIESSKILSLFAGIYDFSNFQPPIICFKKS